MSFVPRAGSRAFAPLVLALLLPSVWSACRSAPEPEALFAEGQELRLAYEKEASERAILTLRDAGDAWMRRGDHPRAAMATHELGATYEQLGLLEDALEEYVEAASLCGDSCEPLLESAIRSDIGFFQANLASGDEALDSADRQCQQALALARAEGALREQAEALNCAGEVAYHRDLHEDALRHHREARLAGEGSGDRRVRAESHYHEASVLSDMSRFDEAQAFLELARFLWISEGDTRGEALAILGLGQLEFRRGKYQDALNHFRRALGLLERIGDSFWEGSGLGRIGIVYSAMGDGARARSYFEAAVERMRKTHHRTATWDYLLALGYAHLILEEPSEALRRFREALAEAEKAKHDFRKQAYSLNFMSQAYQELGEVQESLKCLERSAELHLSVADPRLEGAIRASMGNADELLESLELAAANFRRALELARDSEDPLAEAGALFGLARVAHARSDLDAARHYIERALEVTEALRENVESHELRTSYFASIHRMHELYIEVLMSLHDQRPREGFAALAFGASERARARSLLESLTEAGVDIREGIDPDLREEESSLKRDIEALVARRVHSQGAAPEELEKLDTEIRYLQSKLDDLRSKIRSESPRYSSLTQPEPLRLEDVQEQILDDDTLLLEYWLGDERSFLWAVSKNEFTSFELAPRADIESAGEHLYELVTARTSVASESYQERKRRLKKADADYWEAGARLSQKLLGPAADRLTRMRLVVIVDGALQTLPFGALPAPGNGSETVPLLAEHEIVNLPSASALAVLRQETLGRERPEGSVAVFADPVFTPDDPRLGDIALLRTGEFNAQRLQATRHEAVAIVAAAPRGTVWHALDFEATRSAVTSPKLGKYRMIHFATHGVADPNNPAMSGIYLSMFDDRGEALDGFLRLHDIYELDLSAELVVLSACSTALGKRIQGEGIVGIVRAFMYAGAERVVASLWEVDDEATRELMARFYHEMLEAGRSPSEALRNAQLTMSRETEWQSPFFWAGFVLQGEWQES